IEYQQVTPGLRQGHGIPNDVDGIMIREVAPSSPLYDEGVVPGDVITEVNGKPVDGIDDFESLISGAEAGSYLRLYVRRFDRRGQGDGVGFFAIVRVP
ncbi:MAG TPA: PDZ domain-containing protein, partial [Thermoanaerobaculia bacterium]|nr:PDZ domain-containing protein [Thermoanaerobaculia bacterium]